MGQWGNAATFTRGDTRIRVVPHLDTGDLFDPITKDSVVDQIIAANIQGDDAIGRTILSELKYKFVGLSYGEWLAFVSSARIQSEQFEARARQTDPSTSHAAASVVDKKIKGLMLTVHEAFVRAGARGLTNTELVEATGLDWNTCTPRVAPLIEKGFLAVAKNSDGSEIKRMGGKGVLQLVRIAV